MSSISTTLRRKIVDRANNRCEYCHLSQTGQEATFHIDHVVPVIVSGLSSFDNLALACVSCSLRKGARQTARDPLTDMETNLFNPRLDAWSDHFRWQGAEVDGLTPVGRATIEALQLNRPLVLAIRDEETLRGRHP